MKIEIVMYSDTKHDYLYYSKCFFSGLFPCGITHTLLTPLDVVKCRRQVDPKKYTSLFHGIKEIYGTNGLRGLYLGWQPTILGYALQGSTKYGFYEYFKDVYTKFMGKDVNRTVGYFISSAMAEIIADCFLCPFESLKLRMQTRENFPKQLAPGIKEMQKEGVNAYYKGLVPLIFRQVPNTMIKFATYENTVRFIYNNILTKQKEYYSKNTQLLVSLASGYVSGTICCLFSNPADTIVSFINSRKTDNKENLSHFIKLIYREVGITGLYRGLSTRILMVGTLSALEWFIYDFFKVISGLTTTGHK